MYDRSDLKHHAGLVDRMAQTVGVDLEEAVLEGRMEFDALADAVLRCAGCSDPGHCAGWLDTAQPGAMPPGYCRNTDLLKALAVEGGQA
ncbi:DUF6455 family protein [Aestuariivita sp.]|jgi:hypothetical protein|uniref:DUF6455 family protein n=1 Tax=Aestuariivita sp. TaxID=1872407 RepID=UPI00216BB664|nr:DUF6455 family protein [Aestuariivita sp.]MCE8008687.1 hypothetical protein [Aestuariivita sp.]